MVILMMAEARIKKWGNSYGIIVPRDVVDRENINEGDVVKVDFIKDDEDGFGMWKKEKYEPFIREKDHRDDAF